MSKDPAATDFSPNARRSPPARAWLAGKWRCAVKHRGRQERAEQLSVAAGQLAQGHPLRQSPHAAPETPRHKNISL